MAHIPKTRLVDSGPALHQAGLVHRVRPPAVAGPYPTVLMLHGRSGNEDVMWIFARALPAQWLAIAPRGIKADPDGGYAWHPRKPDEWPPLSMFDEAVAYVWRLIQAAPELYGANPRRLYLMGFSQGAATAYATALRYPGAIRGVAGLVGFMPAVEDGAVVGAPLRGLPVFMAVGRRDPAIPAPVAERCASALRSAGARLDYREYDTGHKLSVSGLRDLTAWWAAREADA